MREKGKGTREKKQGICLRQGSGRVGNEGLPQDREETDLAQRKTAVYKERYKGNPVLR